MNQTILRNLMMSQIGIREDKSQACDRRSSHKYVSVKVFSRAETLLSNAFTAFIIQFLGGQVLFIDNAQLSH